jgi:acetyl-CoA carboxylase biotin carboxyl carrier protein
VTHQTAGRTPATDADEPGVGLEGLTDDVLPALIARLRASRLGEIEVRTTDWRVRLRRDPKAGTRVASTVAPAADGARVEIANGSVARSTAVGYFTPAPELVVGRSVQAGDLLGTVDVLGISQEVTAPADGVIAEVLAEDGQAVEYGQALAGIDALELELAPEDGEDMG